MRQQAHVCCVVLLAATALWLSPAVLGAEGPPTNIALNRAFRCSVPILEGWTGLVDGNKHTDTAPGCFATANVAKFPKFITIDLGTLCKIKQVVVYNSANGNTRKISIECSKDGENFDTLREAYIFPDRHAMKSSHQFSPRKARFVRLTLHNTWGGGIGGENCIFLREVEVIGWHPDGVVQQPADPLAQFSGQPLCHIGQSVPIFYRYCLSRGTEPLRMGVFGDSFARSAPDSNVHWSKRLAAILGDRFDRGITLKVSDSMGFSAADAGIALDEAEQPYDLIVLTLGLEAALGEESVEKFRTSAADVIELLADRTDAMILLLTPLPIAHDKTMKNYEITRDLNTRQYAAALADLAHERMLPVIMTGPLLASSTQGYTELYGDNLGLSEQGHEILARGMAKIISNE